MENKYYGVIYKITNLVNGKIYIGQTIEPKRRWRDHKNKNNKDNSIIGRAIKKYCIENFVFEIIDDAKSPEELNKLEEKYINELNSLKPNGYNILKYCDGIKVYSDETKDKIRTSRCNRKIKNSSSNYFGVRFIKKSNAWYSYVHFYSEVIGLGSFDFEKDAAMARDLEIIKPKYKGIFELNFPELKEKYLNNEIIINKRKQNLQGSKPNKNSSSKYSGVSFEKDRGKWKAAIRYKQKTYSKRQFTNEVDAAKAYDLLAIKYYGENANLNFPELINEYMALT